MTKRIQKALNVAVHNLLSSNSIIADEIASGHLKVYAWLENEVQVKQRIENAKKQFDYDRFMECSRTDAYHHIFGEKVPVGSICLFIELWRGDQLSEKWYFVGNISTWFNKVYFCYKDKDLDRCYEYMPDFHQVKPMCAFAKDVYKALSIEPNLFEIYYDYQARFYGKKGKIKCDLEIVSEYGYECIDV